MLLLDRLFRASAMVSALSVLVLTAGDVRAQGREPVAATELFAQGREMLKNGDLYKACSLFRESLQLDPAVGTVLNLAECEQRRGQLATALRDWQLAINLAEATNDERVELARERHSALSTTVPRLTVELAPGAPAGTVVSRENVELEKTEFGRPLPVDPGRHVVIVVAPGHQESRTAITLAEGEAKSIVVRVGPPLEPDVPQTQPDVPPVEDMPSNRTLAYVLGGVGAAGVLAAAVSGVMLINKRKSVDEHCDRKECDQAGLDAADAGRALVPINTISWLVGVAGLGSGAYLYFSAPPHDVAQPSGPPPSGAYVQVRGNF